MPVNDSWIAATALALGIAVVTQDDDYVEALRETFGRAVSAHLRSIHPVGAQLSSGCDSSAVTATAARLLEAQQRSLTAFTAAPR